MKAICPGLFAAALLAASLMAASPCRADPPLAGASLFTVSHGQPFCTSPGALRALLRAQIARAPLDSWGLPAGCQYVADNALTFVDADLRPRGRYMHMVRARADIGFGAVDGFTYSVGLYPYPVRYEIPPIRLF